MSDSVCLLLFLKKELTMSCVNNMEIPSLLSLELFNSNNIYPDSKSYAISEYINFNTCFHILLVLA